MAQYLQSIGSCYMAIDRIIWKMIGDMNNTKPQFKPSLNHIKAILNHNGMIDTHVNIVENNTHILNHHNTIMGFSDTP